MMKTKTILLLSMLITISSSNAKSQSQRPNVVVFLVDDMGWQDNTQNLPLKAGKGSVYEGGIREPMIVKYPAFVKPATVANQYLIIEDYFPTILELAGIKHDKTKLLPDRTK